MAEEQAPGRVTYCEQSTITEAWAMVSGLPASIDPTESAVLLRAARDARSDLREIPTGAMVPAQTAMVVQSFWYYQVAWASNHFARFGHRYLSTHYVRAIDQDRYERFETTLEPSLVEWLGLYADSLGKNASRHPVDAVGFGYMNTFEFDPAGFDLSRYFKLTIGFEIGPTNVGVMGLSTSFRFMVGNLQTTISLNAESPPNLDTGKMRVTTRIFAECRLKDETSFADTDHLLAQIVSAKDSAKDVFFGFTTEDTKTLMGAQYDVATAQ